MFDSCSGHQKPLVYYIARMDSEIQELKMLVQKNLEVTADTNRVVHAMRRNARMANLFRIVYWLAIIGILSASYYFYVAPYVSKLEAAFQQTQNTSTQAQSYLQNLQQSVQKFISLPQAPKATQ